MLNPYQDGVIDRLETLIWQPGGGVNGRYRLGLWLKPFGSASFIFIAETVSLLSNVGGFVGGAISPVNLSHGTAYYIGVCGVNSDQGHFAFDGLNANQPYQLSLLFDNPFPGGVAPGDPCPSLSGLTIPNNQSSRRVYVRGSKL
jgi:hypothetical protein